MRMMLSLSLLFHTMGVLLCVSVGHSGCSAGRLKTLEFYVFIYDSSFPLIKQFYISHIPCSAYSSAGYQIIIMTFS